MRKKANKLLALLTAVAITVTGVNVPANNASAASAKLSKKKITLTAGKKKTIYLKKGKKKLAIKSVKSSKKKVATVKKSGKKIVITAKKKGTATITVKAKVNKKVKSFKCKVTVKSKATPTAAPTAAPSAAASSAPASQAPASAVPSDAPSAVPSDAASAAPSDDASAAPSADASAQPSAEPTATAEPTVKPVDKVPTEIRIAGGFVAGSDKECVQQALTNKNGTEAYVYYDVFNKDGKSIRSYIDLQWNTSPAGAVANKTTGRIKIKKGTNSTDKFNYGDKIFLNAVYQGVGADKQPMVLTQSGEVSVGLEQSVNTIEPAGFINKNDNPLKLYTQNDQGVVEGLEDFAQNTWYFAFETFDQNGNALDVTENEFGSKNLNIISKNPMALEVDSNFDNAKNFSVTDKDGLVTEYAAVPIKPGDWVDRGEEITLMVISTKTGNKYDYTFTIGEATVLQSLKITGVKNNADLADGDQDVELTYEALDTKGNEIKGYEAIVRSSNKLNISCSPGNLTIAETDAGEAKITWSDDLGYANYTANDNGSTGIGTFDNVQRYLNIVTTVVGTTGVTNTTPLYIGDIRVPREVQSVDSSKIAKAVMETGSISSVDLTDGEALVFQDQYGTKMNSTAVKKFFAASNNISSGWSVNNRAYGVRVKTPATPGLTLSGTQTTNDLNTAHSTIFQRPNTMTLTPAATVANAGTDTLRFAVASLNTNNSNLNKALTDSWDNEGKEKSYDITYVGMKHLQDLKIKEVDGLYEVSAKTASGGSVRVEKGDANGDDTAISSAEFVDTLNFKVVGKYKGMDVTVPANQNWFYADTTSKFGVTDAGVVNNLSTTGLVEKDFFDFKTYGNPAKASVPFELRINLPKNKAMNVEVAASSAALSVDTDYVNKIYTEVKVSAEVAVPTTIKFSKWGSEGTSFLVTPWCIHAGAGDLPVAKVYTQYGKEVANADIVYTVSNIQQATDKNTHLADDVEVTGNGSAAPDIKNIEIGDKFDLAAKMVGVSLEGTCKVTIGADSMAKLSTLASVNNDETFRHEALKMKR